MQLSYQGAFFSACVHESSEGAVISQWNFREADPRRPYTSLCSIPGSGKLVQKSFKVGGAGSSIRPSTACLPKAGLFASSPR